MEIIYNNRYIILYYALISHEPFRCTWPQMFAPPCFFFVFFFHVSWKLWKLVRCAHLQVFSCVHGGNDCIIIKKVINVRLNTGPFFQLSNQTIMWQKQCIKSYRYGSRASINVQVRMGKTCDLSDGRWHSYWYPFEYFRYWCIPGILKHKSL